MVIDCADTSMDRANNLKLWCTTYSNYESTTTFTAVTGVAPCDVITLAYVLYDK